MGSDNYGKWGFDPVKGIVDVPASEWEFDPAVGFINNSSGEVVGTQGAKTLHQAMDAGGPRPGEVVILPADPAKSPGRVVDGRDPTVYPPTLPSPVAKFLGDQVSAELAPPPGTVTPKLDVDFHNTPLFWRRMFWHILDAGDKQQRWRVAEWQERFDDAVADLSRDHGRVEAEVAAFDAYIPAVCWETGLTVTTGDPKGRTFVTTLYDFPGGKPATCPPVWQPPPRRPAPNHAPSRAPGAPPPPPGYAGRVGQAPTPIPPDPAPTLFESGPRPKRPRH